MIAEHLFLVLKADAIAADMHEAPGATVLFHD
jgi:hypothetical protein